MSKPRLRGSGAWGDGSSLRRRCLLVAALAVLLGAGAIGPTTPAGAAGPESQVFAIPGSYEFVVPHGVTRLQVVAIGGGGAGGIYYPPSNGGAGDGGNGAKVTTTLDVRPGQVIPLVVGAGGVAAGATSAGGGGDLTSVNVGLADQVIAGGGGGGGNPGGGSGGSGGVWYDVGNGPHYDGRGGDGSIGAGGLFRRDDRGLGGGGGVGGFEGGAGGGKGVVGVEGQGGDGGDGFGGGTGGGNNPTGGSGGGAGGSTGPSGRTTYRPANNAGDPLQAGGAGSVTFTWTADTTPPSVVLTAPADRAAYAQGESVEVGYSCADEADGTGLDSCVGDLPSGASLDTTALGPHEFTVTGRDLGGNEQVVTHSFVVRDVTGPSVDFRSPAEGASFVRGAHVSADFGCVDEAGGSGIASCVGSGASGDLVPTDTLGVHELTVTATDGDGNVTTASRSYIVVDGTPPAVTIRTPAPGAVYDRGQPVSLDIACEDEAGGSGVASCRANVDGGLLDTSRSGYHLVVLVGVDQAGNTAVAVRGYTVTDEVDPSITVTSPEEGGVYPRGQAVGAEYSCRDDEGGAGIASCVGSVASGSPLDTSTVGEHELTVVAVDAAGNRTEVERSYTVADARPDVRLRADRGTGLIGDDVYVAGAVQRRVRTVDVGQVARSVVSIQNDAGFTDRMVLRGQGRTTHLRVRYLDESGADITAAVLAGTYVTAPLAPGDATAVTVETKLARGAPPALSVRRTLTATSETHPTISDTATIVTRRR